MKTVCIAADGSGDFVSISQALPHLTVDEPVHFFLRNGIYTDRPVLELDEYLLEGESRDGVVLTGSVGAKDPWADGKPTRTFRTATLFLGGKRARVEHLTVRNTAGDGAIAGQALAVYADATRLCMANVTLDGNQDTLFTSPLPVAEREPGGFTGPRKDSPRIMCRQLYVNCRIRGNIDFIFGGADAVFAGCLLEPMPHQSGICYIAAPSTPSGEWGYLFHHCTIQGHCAPGQVYLARPWRSFGAVCYLGCYMSSEVSPAGWDDWKDCANRSSCRFREGVCSGPGSRGKRAFGWRMEESLYPGIEERALLGHIRSRMEEWGFPPTF